MQSSNRVAYNTVILYTRLIINLVVNLYSVRVILNALGPDDYGIYDVIAGIVVLFGFLNTSLSEMSLRYLSVSMGEGKEGGVRSTFNNCFWLHFIIALVLIVLLEAIEPFLFGGFLNIPAERMRAAEIVYQCVSAILFLQIIAAPFSALTIAHENFLYTSTISIVDALLKLGIALVLVYTNSDKLILYGILMVCVNLLNLFFYVVYVVIKYKSDFYISTPNYKGLRQQAGFTGWTIFGVISTLATRQGYAVMLNKFFGTTTNAVYALARQVEGQVYSMSSSVVDAIKPQIMKSYGDGDSERMYRLSITAGKFGFIMTSIVSIPLLVFMPEVLTIWLKQVPEGTVLFARLMVVACLMQVITQGVGYAVQAIGQIKWYTIVVSCIRISPLPISIVLLSLGLPAYSALIVYVSGESLGSLARVFMLKRLGNYDIVLFFKDVFFRVLPPFILSIGVCYLLSIYVKGIAIMLCFIAISIIAYITIVYYVGLTPYEKSTIKSIIKRFLKPKAKTC